MNALPYFIYLDTKIIGAVWQVVVFFRNGIFPLERTTVLIKKYKHKSSRQIYKILQEQGIQVQFVNAAQMDKLSSGVVFYPFNAQSNCRMVANRNLLHIFVSHGESSKAASIKPIIRIYDYVCMAGQAGVDRFLKHGIFTDYDEQVGRLLKVGDTFVGSTGLSSQGKQSVVLYAPTWEGGIDAENYSSLGSYERLLSIFRQLKNQYGNQPILIKLHPNTGHRLPIYHQYIYILVKKLLGSGNKVFIYSSSIQISFWQRWRLYRAGAVFVNDLADYAAIFGICDISAMETQFLNENIPYLMCCYEQDALRLRKQKNANYYLDHLILLDKPYSTVDLNIAHESFSKLKQYVIESDISQIPLASRLEHVLNNVEVARVNG